MKKLSIIAALGASALAGGLMAAAPAIAVPAHSAPAVQSHFAVAGMIPGVGTAGAAASTPVPTATGTIYFVDCDATDAGSGTVDSPWNALQAVNDTTFEPGDHILFKRGSTCGGALRPLGSGASGAPIVIDAYGSGSEKPLIAGGGIDATVELSNQQYWEIRNLEITNIDADTSARYNHERRGIVVKVEDIGQANYYRIEDLDIHDVYGEGKKDLGGSGGIQFEVYANANNDDRVPTWFNDIVVANNTVENVNRSGINMSTAWKCRSEVGWNGCAGADRTNLPWTPWTGMVISGNTVKHIGGDAIVVQMNKGALVEHNTVSDAANRSNGSNAGVWAWNADETVFQYNEVSDMKKLWDNNDGTAFDADYGTTDTVFQYNYSHDNEGGMMLFCGCGGLSTQVTVRYNISENDLKRVNFVAGGTQDEFYNNTIVLPDEAGHFLNQGAGAGNTLLMANNLIIASQAVTNNGGDNTPWRNNAFSGPGGTWPVGDGNVEISQKLALASGSGLDRFKIDDSNLAGAGIPIAGPGTIDAFGNTVPSSCKPDIGAYQFSSFDDGDCALSGDLAAGGHATDVPVRPNTTYRVSGDLASGASLTVTNPNGFATPSVVDDGSVVFTTAMNATTVTVDCVGGTCSNLSMNAIDDSIIDGSFDATANTPWSIWNTSHDAAHAVSGMSASKISNVGSSEQTKVFIQPNTNYVYSGWVESDGGAVQLGLKNFSGNQDPNDPDQWQHYESVSASTMTYTSVHFNSGNTNMVTAYCYKPDNGTGYCDDITLTPATDAPKVALQPQSSSVRDGGNAYFEAGFAGTVQPLVIHWQTNTGDGWNTIDGSLGSALTVNKVTTDDSGTQYRAVIDGPNGTVASDQATLTVLPKFAAPVVTTEPKSDVAAHSGDDVTLTSHASAVPAASVQWEYSTDGTTWKPVTVGTLAATTDGDALKLTGVTESDSGSYRAVFSNAFGSATSDPAMLTVTAVDEGGVTPPTDGSNGSNGAGSNTGSSTGPNAGDNAAGSLASTGSNLVGWPMGFAGLFLALGCALIVIRRRRSSSFGR